MIPSAPQAQPDHVEMTEEVRKDIFEILYMNCGVVELGKKVQALRSGGSSCGSSTSLLKSTKRSTVRLRSSWLERRD